MKTLLFIFALIIVNYSFGQVFYKSFGKSEFKKLVENGITYIKTGDTLRDNRFVKALEDNWSASKFRIVDLSDEDNEEELAEDDIVFFEARINGNEAILGIIELTHLVKKTVSKYNSIGYIVLDGFDQNDAFEPNSNFFDLTISGLNDVVETIHSNKIKKIGSGLYKKIYSSILPKSKSLKNKTLLIVGDTKKYVKTDVLTKNNVKFKLVSREEYLEMLESDLSDYCLLYFSYNSFTEVSIYDLSDNSLIYSRHYASAKSKLSGGDVSDIVKQW